MIVERTQTSGLGCGTRWQAHASPKTPFVAILLFSDKSPRIADRSLGHTGRPFTGRHPYIPRHPRL